MSPVQSNYIVIYIVFETMVIYNVLYIDGVAGSGVVDLVCFDYVVDDVW